MNPKFDWLHPDFNHTLVGACNEVYNLGPARPGDVARPLDMNITITDAGAGAGAGAGAAVAVAADRDRVVGVGGDARLPWMSDWQVNEGLPQCASGLRGISLTTTYASSAAGSSQTARLRAS